jgi:hypothetical protein
MLIETLHAALRQFSRKGKMTDPYEIKVSLDDPILIEPVYTPEGIAYPAFFEFDARIGSLQRLFYATEKFLSAYTANTTLYAKEAKGWSAEDHDVIGDAIHTDSQHFIQYLRGSTLAHLLSLLEIYLADVAQEVAGEKPRLTTGQEPYIERYLEFLRRSGLTIVLNTNERKDLDTLRKVRNKFIHEIGKDLPEFIEREVRELLKRANAGEEQIQADFIQVAFVTIGKVAKRVEIAFLRHTGAID